MTTVRGTASGQRVHRQRPLLSIVLAVGQVEKFLPMCLDSVLGQPDPPGGTEIIAVGDASPDACGRILDGRAAQAASRGPVVSG